MKNLLLIFTLLFSSVFFTSPSYAGWTKVSKNTNGTTYYVDYERIRKHDGYVYYWLLSDYLKPKMGDLSAKVYRQGDCKLFRFKILSETLCKEPMGGGTGETHNKPDKDWTYPSPNSVDEVILKSVCSR
jgi:hypothetical protein